MKSIKFAERAQKKQSLKSTGNSYSDSFENNLEISYLSWLNLYRANFNKSVSLNPSNVRARPRDFRVRSRPAKKGKSVLKNVRREPYMMNNLKKEKRPSTKEAIDRGHHISGISENGDATSAQFNTAYPIKTPVPTSSKHGDIDSGHIYGLSKTNESFKKSKWMSGSKAQSSTIGFSASTENTTKYSKEHGDSAGFRSSKYVPSGEQSSISRSSFYV